MISYKAKPRKLILCIIILLIMGLLSNNFAFGFSRMSCFNQDSERSQLYKSVAFSHPDHYDFLEAWDTGSGQDVKIGPDGNIYLSSGSNILIYNTQGSYISRWTGGGYFVDINGFDFDSQGNLYAVEGFSHQVVKLDSEGSFVLAWGSEGVGDGQFKAASRIACDSQDNVYVADNGLWPNRIQKFDSNGNFIRSWNLPYGDGGGCIGLAIDSQDFVYVVGEFFLKFDVDGNLINEWGTPLTDDGRFNGPHGLAIDSLDALYLTEILWGLPNARIQKFDSNGVFITEFGLDGGQGQLTIPTGITIASNGLVYVIDVEEDKGSIKIYTPGTESHSITEPTVIYPNGGETLNGTVEVQWTPSNDSLNHSVTYSVYSSANNGASWNMLISGLNSTSYNWNTAKLHGDKYRIKVVTYCLFVTTSEDTSDEVFTVLTISPPILVSPSSDTVLSGIIPIQWQPPPNIAGMNVTYTVSYSANNGESWITLISDLTTTSCLWDTTNVPEGTNYLIKVEIIYPGGGKAMVISDSTFTIENTSSLIGTIILPIPVAIVLFGLLFWVNRIVVRIEEENVITSKE